MKVRDIKRGNRATTINNQITEVSIWTDFNIMPCIRDAVQLNSVKMRSKTLCRKKHLVTLCSETFKRTLCSRQGAVLHGRRKLCTLVLDRPDILSLWDLEGLLLSEVVFTNSVGGKVQQADPRSQAY